MPGKAVISLTTGLEDPEKVTVAFLVAVNAAESGRRTLMFLAKETVRLAVNGVATGIACAGCPPIPELLERYERAGGSYLVCPSASMSSRSTGAASCRTRRSAGPS
jgi:predicted peroxiredoxin